MSPRVLGYVMARNEWPLIGLAITHALSAGVDEIVVVDHASDDVTRNGLQSLREAWPDRLTVLRLEGDQFLQEATTSVITAVVGARSYDWVYVFDADEFILTRPDSTLKDVLAKVPPGTDAVRYHIDQWVAPSDFDDLAVDDYDRIRHRAITPIFAEPPAELLAEEIEQANLNFFDVPFGSKVIVRGDLSHAIGPGAHLLKTSWRPKEITLDPSVVRVGHVPFLSRRRLDRRCQRGRALKEEGFPPTHGWQSQMLSRIDEDGQLDTFWLNHSVHAKTGIQADRAAEPVTTIDMTLSNAFKAATTNLSTALRTNDNGTPEKPTSLSDQGTSWSAITRSVHRQLVERDAAIAERDAAIAERDAAIAERDAAIAERDAAAAERDTAIAERDTAIADRDAAVNRAEVIEGSKSWRLTTWLRRVRATFRR